MVSCWVAGPKMSMMLKKIISIMFIINDVNDFHAWHPYFNKIDFHAVHDIFYYDFPDVDSYVLDVYDLHVDYIQVVPDDFVH